MPLLDLVILFVWLLSVAILVLWLARPMLFRLQEGEVIDHMYWPPYRTVTSGPIHAIPSLANVYERDVPAAWGIKVRHGRRNSWIESTDPNFHQCYPIGSYYNSATGTKTS